MTISDDPASHGPATPDAADDDGRSRSRTVFVLLAAGAGSRFAGDGHKLTATLQAEPSSSTHASSTVFSRSLDAAVRARRAPIVVVTGRLSAADLGITEPEDGGRRTTHAGGVRTDGPGSGGGDDRSALGAEPVTAVHNPHWAEGQMSSVRVGLDAAAERGARAAVIGLGDQPGITSDAWRAVAEAVDAGAAIAVATYGGRRANPVGLHRDVWALLDTRGDEGARGLMRLRPDLVVEVPCTGSPDDIDTVEDLTTWQNN